jgi:G3E family GTPase
MTKLIFVGGFLGAGKTTLLYEVTNILKERGKKVGLITNDQAPDLVDTSLLEQISINVAEVSGSCFCCDFKAFRKAMEKVSSNDKPDIIIAEPVGSCTDLSATLINPIKDMMKTEISVSPLTVLADPGRIRSILDGTADLHPSAAYIIKKQLEESDIILITKTDLYPQEEINTISARLKESFPECEVRAVSAKTGEGVQDWLDLVLTGENAGRHILDIDYDRYAEGEAVLGWLNCSASLSGNDVDWDAFTRSFMKDFAARLDTNNLPVGHVKMIVENGDQYISANLTGRSETLAYRWSAGSGDSAEMKVNARVEMSPADLEEIFKSSLNACENDSIKVNIRSLKSISPGYPNPTYRYTKR